MISENLNLGLYGLMIGMSVVLFVLGLLTALTYLMSYLVQKYKPTRLLEKIDDTNSQVHIIDPMVVAAITSVVATLENRKFKIHRVRYLEQSLQESSWQDIGRTKLFSARNPVKKGN